MLRWWIRFQLRRMGIRPPDPEFAYVSPFWQTCYRLRDLSRRHTG